MVSNINYQFQFDYIQQHFFTSRHCDARNNFRELSFRYFSFLLMLQRNLDLDLQLLTPLENKSEKIKDILLSFE